MATLADDPPLRWPSADGSAVPYRLFFEQDVFDREQERIFGGPIWSFIGLAEEIPAPGDYKATNVGVTPVVMVRGKGGEIHGWVNRCIHRGAKVCRHLRGNVRNFTCIYHQWQYGLDGSLLGVPFRKGLKTMQGMPEGFDMKAERLQPVRVATYKSLVFATFDPAAPPLEDYLGEEMRPLIDAIFCKPIIFLGITRQRIQANWKLYFENVKDPYHGHLLHLFHNSFNVSRPTMDVGNRIDARTGLHSAIVGIANNAMHDTSIYKGADGAKVSTFKEDATLADPEVIRARPETSPQVKSQVQSIFPSLVLQRIHNSLAARQIVPIAPDEFELVFHMFGYADDDEELQDMRLLQANLVGPAGFISMEDGEATEIVQAAVSQPGNEGRSRMLMGKGAPEGHVSLITEELIRSFWRGYSAIMAD